MTQAPYESSVPHDVSRNSKAHPADTPLSTQISDRIEKKKKINWKNHVSSSALHISLQNKAGALSTLIISV